MTTLVLGLPVREVVGAFGHHSESNPYNRFSAVFVVRDTNAHSRGHPKKTMTVSVLLRHGETDWNANRRVQGWAPTPLSERGREQAANAGAHLAATYEFDRVVASDLRRTRETAVLAREGGIDAEPKFERAWRERDFGVYQGLSYEALFDEYPEFAVTESGTAALRATPEGGESLLDLRERVLGDFEHLVEECEGETVLVVTHGGPLYALLGHVKGLDYATAIAEGSQENCAVNELQDGSEEIELVRENDTSYR